MKHNQWANASLNPGASSASEARTYVINHDPIAYRYGASMTEFPQVS